MTQFLHWHNKENRLRFYFVVEVKKVLLSFLAVEGDIRAILNISNPLSNFNILGQWRLKTIKISKQCFREVSNIYLSFGSESYVVQIERNRLPDPVLLTFWKFCETLVQYTGSKEWRWSWFSIATTRTHQLSEKTFDGPPPRNIEIDVFWKLLKNVVLWETRQPPRFHLRGHGTFSLSFEKLLPRS